MHNVTLSSDSVEYVPESSVSAEEKALSLREMASWKFSLSFERSVRPVLRWCLRASQGASTGPNFAVLYYGEGWRVWRGRSSYWSLRELVDKFKEPPGSRESGFPLFRSVIDTRPDRELPPPYDDGVAWVEVAKTGEKK